MEVKSLYVSPYHRKKYKNQVEENEEVRIARNEHERATGTRLQEPRANDGKRRTTGATLSEIEPGSIAEELGLLPGSRVLEINEKPVRDAIQLKMADASERVSLTVISPMAIRRSSTSKKTRSSRWAFMSIRTLRWRNALPEQVPVLFCRSVAAASQRREALAPHALCARRRLPFELPARPLHHANQPQRRDYERIVNEKLSPLCVSVQATDPATRVRMLGNNTAGNIMERLRFLIDNGITINAQIVLCPGINDREQLNKSIEDLMTLYPGVESMAIVPVGLTKFMPADRGMRVVSATEAKNIIEQIKPYQEKCLEEIGVRFVYASDEMYLLSGQKFPGAKWYDGFPQYSNGVGLMRSFLDDVAKVRRKRYRVLNESRVRVSHL
jgi:hypothetical protein